MLGWTRKSSCTLRLDFNQFYARVLRAARMHAISKVTKPRGYHFGVDFFDSSVVVAARYDFAGNRDPIRVATVLERNVYNLVLLNVVKFLAVGVGKEEEVWSRALRNCHGTCNRLRLGRFSDNSYRS